MSKYLEALVSRNPKLKMVEDSINEAYKTMVECYQNNGKLLIAGNGGSCADAEHMVGELMKNFKINRSIDKDLLEKLRESADIYSRELEHDLTGALPAICLNSNMALFTAYLNDVEGTSYYAQMVYSLAKENDVFVGISTSGNSKNIIKAAIVAKLKRNKIVILTGKNGGALANYADICIKVPEEETYLIQELHLTIYHCLCLMLEEYFFAS